MITSYTFMPKLNFTQYFKLWQTYNDLNPSTNVYLFHYQKYSQIPVSQNLLYKTWGTIKKKKTLLKKAGSEYLINHTEHFLLYTKTILKHILKY